MYNRTVTFNTNSEDLVKAVNSLLFYLNVSKERVLTDSEYPTSHEIIMPFQEARALLVAMYHLSTFPDSEHYPEDSQCSLEQHYIDAKTLPEE